MHSMHTGVAVQLVAETCHCNFFPLSVSSHQVSRLVVTLIYYYVFWSFMIGKHLDLSTVCFSFS